MEPPKIPIEIPAIMKCEPPDVERWIVHLLDDRGATVKPGTTVANVPFPTLAPDETPADYLVTAIIKCEHEADYRQRLRTTVVSLIRVECGPYRLANRDDVLGHLLNVARRCDFIEIEEKLWGWVCRDRYPNVMCKDGGRRVSLRVLIWSTLLKWDLKREWLPKLIPDLDREDCLALCFDAVAALEPLDAFPHIPGVLKLQPAYSRRLVAAWIRRMGVGRALARDMLPRWQRLLSDIEYDDDLAYLLEPDGFRITKEQAEPPTVLWLALDDVGICLHHPKAVAVLRDKNPPYQQLEVSLLDEDVGSDTWIIEHSRMSQDKLRHICFPDGAIIANNVKVA